MCCKAWWPEVDPQIPEWKARADSNKLSSGLCMHRHFSCVKAPFSTSIRSWSPSSPSLNIYFSQKPHIQAHQKAHTLLLPVPMLRWFPYSFNIAYSSPEFTVLCSQICWSTLLHSEKYLCFRMGKDSMFSAYSRLEGLLLWAYGKVQWKCVSEQTAHLLVAGKRGKKEEADALQGPPFNDRKLLDWNSTSQTLNRNLPASWKTVPGASQT